VTPPHTPDVVIQKLQNSLDNRHARLRDWKEENGKPIIGYFCSYTPVEVIAAAGILPVRLLSSPEHIRESGTSLPHFACHFARSAVDLGMRGVTDYLNGIVACRTCDTIRLSFDVWQKHVPHEYSFFLQTPSFLEGDGVQDFWRREMALFRESVEKYIGKDITDNDLRESIHAYNRNRHLMRQIYELRKEEKILISGTEVVYSLLAGLTMPVEEHNGLLNELLALLPERTPLEKNRVRLMILSAALDHSNLEIVQEIENAGGVVVTDSSCVGSRNISDDVKMNGDPLESIGKRYLNRIPCPSKSPIKPWFDNILNLAEEYRVEGAVFMIEKFCDPHGFPYPDLRDALKKKNIPSIKIDVGEAISRGQVNTRVGAFYEMIRGV
jgi:benzoyl-CoA reductase subunit C